MTRLSPVKHDVGSYTRTDGKRVEKYKRGSRDKPKVKPRPMKRSNKGTDYNVAFMFPSGGSENYNTSGTATGALKAAVSRIQRPELPKSATLRRTT